MIYKRRTHSRSEPGGYFYLENELNNRKAFGFGYGSQIKLEDSTGGVWRGSAERGDGQAVFYRFLNGEGNVVSGIGYGNHVMLRDEQGRAWKGFID